MTTRRSFLAALSGAPSAFAQKKRPNIVMLFTDDQRFDTIRALGHPEVQTPNMDRLVQRGVTFTHACTQGGLHGAICQPSRAQLMTGRSVFRVHKEMITKQDDPNPEYVTFPQQLRKQGYLTFATGKWHNGPILFNRSFADGGNIFFGGMDDHAATKVNEYDPSGRYPKEKMRTAKKFSSETFTDTALEFLKNRDASKPYLLYVPFTSPHDPRMAPSKYESMYAPDKVRIPKNFLPQHPFDNGEMKVRDEMLAPHPRTEEEIRKHIAGYYAMISEVDAQIGRILDAVDASPDAANTYIVFAGDNGLAVGQHGLLGKQSLYDHSWRVPMVISGPGIPKGKRADTLCYIMDLCPTIAEFAGVPMPKNLDARSLRPALQNQSARIRDAVVAPYGEVQRGIRTDRWKLILYNVNGVRRTQLFDLQADPWEMNNLADKSEHAPRIAELKASLQRQLHEAGDPTDLDAPRWASLKDL
jgi:arylsulfatase A-like enzyme